MKFQSEVIHLPQLYDGTHYHRGARQFWGFGRKHTHVLSRVTEDC
jgi:hypothetical protein